MVTRENKKLKELETEVTHWINKYDELRAENIYWKETAEYYKELCYRLEQHNNHLRKISNKTLDK